MREVPRRFWVEVALGVISGLALTATIFWPQWVETFFSVAPDGGSGYLEALLTVAFGATTISTAVAARVLWRRRAAA